MKAPSQNMSGIMHCWLMAKAEFGGRTYVALRGVNWDGRYDLARPYAPQRTPWWHVPTSKFRYDPAHVPSISETLSAVLPRVANEWPALKDAKLAAADQDISGEWGGVDKRGHVEAVARIALDLGTVSSLPEISVRPGQKLPWPRHPVAWVPADEITKLSHKQSQQEAQISPYVVGLQSLIMETGKGVENAMANDLLLQWTVGDMFTKSFGEIFSGPQPRNLIVSWLVHDSLHL